MSARQELLDRCLTWLEVNGATPHSLRQIAAGVGTSHRMLIYHFGSREGLLAEVVARVEQDTRAVLAEVADPADPVTTSRRFWEHVSDPGAADAERLFYEIYADALHGRPWTASFRDAVIDALDEPVTAVFTGLGFPAEQAHVRARLAIAVTRGLLLDLLLTGDRALLTAASDLFAELITRPEAQA